ncbi:TPA: rRNA maturation RNase YbeY [Patescibacteria group bacterium]|nr:MAG: putative rRNA maturation factor [Parcubacteria group bacterium GW2011_GWF2_40_10]KKR47597.1 MAG: putative rRNA maturation factor [Parcubacteria group bacterium GW2011_GWA2_40_143]KKR60155.1 MAG: putative rRNA maturation factor [Parcubacteria group bacterium GW2011_GWC2_40_31]KKR75444.1 MAG: putative rRNA maturation factor [Parcubacteria group bacterium GW2011_GWB2_40_8]KKR76797.1 MAG: putative rRNA maturation factor [Parcubacteria group bacterium GW2011_GWE2_40_8]KKR81820.1 MAG: putati
MRKNWLELKEKVLGKNYDLSFFFLPEAKMKQLNSLYRKKDYAANVLSFPYSKSEGEILINKTYEKKAGEASYLFIHSLLHLQGLSHGKKMEEEEMKLLKKLYPKKWDRIINGFA